LSTEIANMLCEVIERTNAIHKPPLLNKNIYPHDIKEIKVNTVTIGDKIILKKYYCNIRGLRYCITIYTENNKIPKIERSA